MYLEVSVVHPGKKKARGRLQRNADIPYLKNSEITLQLKFSKLKVINSHEIED